MGLDLGDHLSAWRDRWVPPVAYKVAAGAEAVARRRPIRPSETADLLVVFVAWDADRTAAGLAALCPAVTAWGPGACRVVVVVNNPALPLSQVRVPPSGLVVRGSNAVGEFSGYDEGIAAAANWGKPGPAAGGALLLLNDRFLSYGEGARLRVLDPALAGLVVSERLLVGKVEVFPGGGRLLGLPVDRYVKSNWMLLPQPATGVALMSVDSVRFDALVPVAGAPEGWISRSALDPGYAARLHEWLSGEGTSLTSHWYRAEPFTAVTWPAMRLKIRSILNEHALSTRLADDGLTSVQVEQLEVLGRMAPGPRRYWLRRARADPASAVEFPRSPRTRLAAAVSALVPDRGVLGSADGSVQRRTRRGVAGR